YAETMCTIAERLGIATACEFSSLFPTLLRQLEVSLPRNATVYLHLISTLLRVAWPRVLARRQEIFKYVLAHFIRNREKAEACAEYLKALRELLSVFRLFPEAAAEVHILTPLSL